MGKNIITLLIVFIRNYSQINLLKCNIALNITSDELLLKYIWEYTISG